MIYEEFKLPLPVYDRYEKQYRFVKSDAPNHTIVTRDMILPFQFIVNSISEIEDITEWTIRQPDAARTVSYTLTSKVDKLELVETAGGKTYVIYKPSDIGLLMSAGIYHMEFVVDGERYYSEQFEVRCDSPYWADEQTAFTRLEWDNNGCDLGPIMYQTGFKARAYLDSIIHKETPSIEEEGDEDGAGNFIPSRQQYVDNLNVEDILPYYLADALVLMCMHRNVILTTPNTAYSGKIKNIKPTVVQEDNAWLYRVNLTFQQDSSYVSTACCENIPLAVPESDSQECNTSVINLDVSEDSEGYVSATWNVIGSATRVQVIWWYLNGICPSQGGEYLDVGTTSYQIPDKFAPGALTFFVYPECVIGDTTGDTATQGQMASKTISTHNGPSCAAPPPDPEPGDPSGLVIIENNTTDLVIYDITGIPGFNPPPIPPQSGHSGIHAPTIISGVIYVSYNEYLSSNKNMKLYINGVQKQCRGLGSSPAGFIILGLDPIGEMDDIKITVNSGGC